MGKPQLTWRKAAAWRASRHGLSERVPATGMLPLVDGICGLHAQLMSSAEMSAFVRVDGITREDVARALWDDRTLVKLWGLRGTLHLLPAETYWRWQAAFANYDHYTKPVWLRAFGVTREELDAMLVGIDAILRDRVLTREELVGAIVERTGSAHLAEGLRSGWGALLKPASLRGLLVFGPPAGQNVRFTSPSTWLGPRPDDVPPPRDAWFDAVHGFVASCAPVTREAVARWWGGISPAKAQRLLAEIPDLIEIDVDGEPALMLAPDVEAALSVEEKGVVRLLPAFDPYVVGSNTSAEKLMPGPFRDRVYRPNAWFSPVLLVDGRMEGIWRSEHSGSRLAVTVEPFVPQPPAVREAAEAEARRLASFLGGELEFGWQE